MGEIGLHDRPHRLGCAHAPFDLLAGGILAESHMRVQFDRGLAGLRHGERRGIAERDAAVLGPELVLINPGARAAAADSQSETGEVVVEGNRFALALRQFERGNSCLRELHGSPPFWEDYGKIRKLPRSASCGNRQLTCAEIASVLGWCGLLRSRAGGSVAVGVTADKCARMNSKGGWERMIGPSWRSTVIV